MKPKVHYVDQINQPLPPLLFQINLVPSSPIQYLKVLFNFILSPTHKFPNCSFSSRFILQILYVFLSNTCYLRLPSIPHKSYFGVFSSLLSLSPFAQTSFSRTFFSRGNPKNLFMSRKILPIKKNHKKSAVSTNGMLQYLQLKKKVLDIF